MIIRWSLAGASAVLLLLATAFSAQAQQPTETSSIPAPSPQGDEPLLDSEQLMVYGARLMTGRCEFKLPELKLPPGENVIEARSTAVDRLRCVMTVEIGRPSGAKRDQGPQVMGQSLSLT